MDNQKDSRTLGYILIGLGVFTLPLGIILIVLGVRKLKGNPNGEKALPPTAPAPVDISVLDPAVQKSRVTVSGGSSAEYSGGPTFGSWDTSIHLAEGQLLRFGRAVYGEFNIRPFSNGIVKVTGAKGNTYHTSLDSCDCPDFIKRQLPCKHIYALAISKGYSADDFYSAYLDTICSDGVIPRPAIGYSNGLKAFQVRGMNPETKRKNKRAVSAVDETDAITAAHDAGLVDPIEVCGSVEASEFIPVNDWQKELLQQQNIALPTCADYYDAKALLCRSDNAELSAVPVGLLKFATRCHISCSLLVDPQTLLGQLLDRLSRRDQIALYAAAVRCADCGVLLTGGFDDPVSEDCYAFADFAYNDEKLYRALLNSLSVDVLIRPPKNTVTYRAVMKFFASHTDDQA